MASFAQLQFKGINICNFSTKLPIIVKISATVIEILTLVNCFQKFTVSTSLRSMKLTLTSALTAHRAREKTVEMPSRDTPDFISPLQWPPNSPDLKPVDYAIWGKLQQRFYRTRIRDIDHLVERFVQEWSRFDRHTSPVLQLLSGKIVYVRAWRRMEDILNSFFMTIDE